MTSHAYLGVCFGDRTSLAPWSWIDTLAEAMLDAEEASADVDAWAGSKRCMRARDTSASSTPTRDARPTAASWMCGSHLQAAPAKVPSR